MAHTYKWVMAHMWSYSYEWVCIFTHPYEWVMAHIYMIASDTHAYVCHKLIHMSYKYDHICAMTHSYVCHDSFICHVNMIICVPWAPPTLSPRIKHMLCIHIYVYIIKHIIHIHMHIFIYIYTYTFQWLLCGVMWHRVIWQILMKVLPNMDESCHTYE